MGNQQREGNSDRIAQEGQNIGQGQIGRARVSRGDRGLAQSSLDNGFEPYVTASYAFRSKAVGTVEDSDYGQIPAYAVVNLSTGLRGNYEQGQWDVSLWLKNAFDKTYYTTLWTGGNGGYEGLLGTPRTLGLTGRYDF